MVFDFRIDSSDKYSIRVYSNTVQYVLYIGVTWFLRNIVDSVQGNNFNQEKCNS